VTGAGSPADETPPVRYRIADGVATITFDRAETRNAITFAMRDELVALLARAGADPEVRVVVLEGAGGTFTSGVDVHDRPDAQDPAAVSLEEDVAEIAAAAGHWARLWELPQPVVVKARGVCVGWGLELALHADLVVASHDCRFFFPSIRNGSGLPDSSMALYHLGPQWAKRLLLTGDEVDGRTAERIGLVVEAVPDEELDAAVDRLARRLAAVPREVAAESKRVLNHAIDLMGRAALQDFSAQANARARRGPAVAEFSRLVRERGLRAALAWREQRRGAAPPAEP
jgi:enoyl-CoA hydratase